MAAAEALRSRPEGRGCLSSKLASRESMAAPFDAPEYAAPRGPPGPPAPARAGAGLVTGPGAPPLAPRGFEDVRELPAYVIGYRSYGKGPWDAAVGRQKQWLRVQEMRGSELQASFRPNCAPEP